MKYRVNTLPFVVILVLGAVATVQIVGLRSFFTDAEEAVEALSLDFMDAHIETVARTFEQVNERGITAPTASLTGAQDLEAFQAAYRSFETERPQAPVPSGTLVARSLVDPAGTMVDLTVYGRRDISAAVAAWIENHAGAGDYRTLLATPTVQYAAVVVAELNGWRVIHVIDLTRPMERYLGSTRIGTFGTIWAIDLNGVVLFDDEREIIGQNVFDLHADYPELVATDQRMVGEPAGTAWYEFYTVRGGELTRKAVAWRRVTVGSYPMVIALSIPSQTVHAGTGNLERRVTTTALITLVLLAVLMTLIVVEQYRMGAKLERILRGRVEERAQRIAELRRELTAEQRAARDRIEFQARMIDAVDHAIIASDGDGYVTYMNAAAERLFGQPRAQVIGERGHTLIRPEPPVPIEQSRATLEELRSGKTTTSDITVRTGNGALVPIRAIDTPVINDEGELSGIIAVAIDMSEDRKREAELRSALDTRNRLLANMSHELRTPLNGIVGMTRLLVESRTNDERSHYAALLNEAVRYQTRVIDDLLLFSRLEAQGLSLTREEVRLALVAETVRATFDGQQHASLEVSIEAGTPEIVITDGVRLFEILFNLVSNAVKFTPVTGTITVDITVTRAKSAPSGTNPGVLQIAVHDTGPGIPAAEHERVFVEFEQLDSTSTKRHQGTGLGLSIVRQLVELLGGTITLESEAGAGAHFHVAIPVDITSGGATGAVERTTLDERVTPTTSDATRTRRILVAEDERINQIFMRSLLERHGFEVTLTTNGAEAITAFDEAATANHAYDAILLDIQMPEVDGYEAVREIRTRETEHNVVIALTAYATPEAATEMAAAGFDSVLPKPLDIDQLLAVLASL